MIELSRQEVLDLLKAVEYTHRFHVEHDRPDWLVDRVQRLMLLSGKLNKLLPNLT